MRHAGRFLVLPFLTLVAALPSRAADAPRQDKESAATSPRLKYLPNDYWLAAECDVATVMKFLNSDAAQANPQFAQFQQYMQMIKQLTSIDPQTDVDAVTLFAAGKLDDPKWLVAVQGSFRNATVIKRLSAKLKDGIADDQYKERTIYTAENMTLFFPETSTLLLGDESLVKGAIDQLAEDKRKLPESLKSVLDKTSNKSIAWAAVRLPALLDQKDFIPEWLTGDGDLMKALKKIECMSVTVDVSEQGVALKGLGYVADGEAKGVYKYLADRKKTLLHQEGANVLFTTLLILADIKMNDTLLEGSFRLTADSLQELWNTKVIVKPGSGSGTKEK